MRTRNYLSKRDMYEILRSISERCKILNQRKWFDLHRIYLGSCFLTPRSAAHYMRHTWNFHSTNHRLEKQQKYGSVRAYDAAHTCKTQGRSDGAPNGPYQGIK